MDTVVGILKGRDMLACIQALEKLEKEAQTIVDQTPDSQLDEEWEKWQGVAVSARAALGTFRTIMKNAAKINENPDTSFTIRWEGSLEQAMDAMGLIYARPEQLPGAGPNAESEDENSRKSVDNE